MPDRLNPWEENPPAPPEPKKFGDVPFRPTIVRRLLLQEEFPWEVK